MGGGPCYFLNEEEESIFEENLWVKILWPLLELDGEGLGSSTVLVFSGFGKPLFERPLLVGGGPCYFLNEEEEISMQSIFDENLGPRKILSKVNLDIALLE